MRTCALFAIAVVFSAESAAVAQSYNIAFGPSGLVPSDHYAAAGLGGRWQALTASHGSTTFNLVDIDATVTNARLTQIGGTAILSINDSATTGDDQVLMDNCLVTYNASVESCLFFYDLQDGAYEVLVYAWMPRSPSIGAYVSSDEEPGFPHKTVGGTWPGGHSELVTYSRHYCFVGSPFPGRLRVHSGIVPGASAANGAALNGIQLRKLPPPAPADMNCDGIVDALDVVEFTAALMDPQTYYAAEPTCRILNGDFNGDYRITTADIAPFVAELLSE